MKDEETLSIDDDVNTKKTKKKLKKWVKLLFSFIILIIMFIILSIVIYFYMLSPVSSKSSITTFDLKDGMSVYQAGDELENLKLIRSSFAYKVYVKLNNVTQYKAGIYKIDPSKSTKEIVSLLSGDDYSLNSNTITFKEGKNFRNVAKTVAKHTNITESEFLKEACDKDYVDQLINKYWFLTDDIKNSNIYYPLEGYLYPDTYSFKENVTSKDIIETMLNQTDKKWSLYKDKLSSGKLTINQYAALASVVESEGIYDADRKNIAGVFYNRLNSNMSLGSDVTTYYAFKVDLGERDLKNSEINTYNAYNTRGPNMNGKLPVGAISNFGETSLDAVLNPVSNDYYYFVADKSGKTHFTKTYEEHMKVIKELKSSNNWIEW